MGLYNNLRSHVDTAYNVNIPEVVQPNLSLSPKEILERFTNSDVNLHQYEPSDDVIDNMSDDDFDNDDNFDPDDVQFSDDNFELYENTLTLSNELRNKKNEHSSIRDDSSAGGDSDQHNAGAGSSETPQGV